MSDMRYVAGAVDGWLNVRREPSGTIVALPEFTRVELEASSAGRDLFVAQEGVERGKRFPVKVGNLMVGNPGYQSAVSLEFSIGRESLRYPGGTVKAITHSRNPVPTGSHPIQMPDFPHQLGVGYMGQSLYAKSWFYLGLGNAVRGNNDRYLHPGSVSAGCITVDASEWTKLYRYLILSRSGDGKTVGTVSVVR